MNNFDKIPNLTLKKYKRDNYQFTSIEGTISIRTWDEFQDRNPAYDQLKSPDRKVRLAIGGDMILDEPQITESHVNAYHYTLENSEIVKESILLSLLNHYTEFKKLYEFEMEMENEALPHITDIAQFKNLIYLSSIYLMNIENDGIAYVGYEFGCAWDLHHGLGIMTHRDRVCRIGGADTSFLTWVAEEDLEINGGIENYKI